MRSHTDACVILHSTHLHFNTFFAQRIGEDSNSYRRALYDNDLFGGCCCFFSFFQLLFCGVIIVNCLHKSFLLSNFIIPSQNFNARTRLLLVTFLSSTITTNANIWLRANVIRFHVCVCACAH